MFRSSILLLALLVHHHKPCTGLLCGGQLIQNQEIDRLQLPRIVDDRQLLQLEQSGELVRIQENEKVKFQSCIPVDKRFVRPWTAAFVQDMAVDFYSMFPGVPLIIDSAVRTEEQQQQLRRYNRFAAPEVGDSASSHLAGTTIDLAKRKYNRKQRWWISNYLTTMVEKGLAIVASEPYCYHVFVRSGYINEK